MPAGGLYKGQDKARQRDLAKRNRAFERSPRASVPKAPGLQGQFAEDRDSLKALYMQKKRRR